MQFEMQQVAEIRDGEARNDLATHARISEASAARKAAAIARFENHRQALGRKMRVASVGISKPLRRPSQAPFEYRLGVNQFTAHLLHAGFSQIGMMYRMRANFVTQPGHFPYVIPAEIRQTRKIAVPRKNV